MKYTKISIIIKSEQKPPYFIGSQLRGALGYALKKVSIFRIQQKIQRSMRKKKRSFLFI